MPVSEGYWRGCLFVMAMTADQSEIRKAYLVFVDFCRYVGRNVKNSLIVYCVSYRNVIE